MQLASK